jgi:SSS family solute:Na+ symporter/sodium/pantothenate symporter
MTSLPFAAGGLWAQAVSPSVLLAFGAYMVGVFLLGALAHHLLSRGSFLKEYFLGDRKLNAWVLSLTYVATSVSAGSFVGFPSLIYVHGWIMALWIGGYMIAGLVTKGVLAKRLNQVSRLTGAITVPDVLRDRFRSPALGLFASVFLLLFLLFNLVAQFKAGGLILREACRGVRETATYDAARNGTARVLTAVGAWDEGTAVKEAQQESLRAQARAVAAVAVAPTAGFPASLPWGPLVLTAEKRQPNFFGLDYPDYVLGILLFALTVIAYTTYGGFWAVTWTDVLQGLVIVAGALLLMGFALAKVGGLGAATERLRHTQPALLTGPGPGGFLPLGLAVSFFFLWTIGAMGQPVGMVRLMACRDTPTLRVSLFMIGLFYALIYLPLVITFVCARALYPTEYLREPDSIMPAMALAFTEEWPLIGGLILAAPYAAAMSAVAGFLLLMSSSLVRDIYQRNINPAVSPRAIRWISYGTTAVAGVIVTAGALWPPRFLQYIIVFTGAGMGCTFLAPTVLALYWRRATRAGALAALMAGFVSVGALYVLGWADVGKKGLSGPAAERFAPLYLLGLDPLIWGLVASFGLGIGVSLLTRPLPAEQVDRYFVEGAGHERTD